MNYTQQFFSTMFWLVLGVFVFLLSVQVCRAAPCWAILIPVAIISYPFWLQLRESYLFKRRLLLSGATLESSQFRRWFWRGHFGSSLLLGLALAFATLLIAFVISFPLIYWIILLIDTAIVAALYLTFKRISASQFREESSGVIIRVWPLWLTNMVILSLLFFGADFFIVGSQDWRFTAWHEVIQQTFETSSQTVSCSWLAWLVGILAVIDQSKWALAQQVIPNLPGTEWRLAGWAFILITWGFFSYLMTSFLMGVLSLIEQRQLRTESLLGKSTLSKTYLITILVLAIPYVLISQKISTIDFKNFSNYALEIIPQVDPCKEFHENINDAHLTLGSIIATGREEAQSKAFSSTENYVQELFDDIETAVDSFLDDYYTIIAEYLRLGYAVTGGFAKYLEGKIAEHLFENTRFADRLEVIDRRITNQSIASMENLAQGLKFHLENEATENACVAKALYLPHIDELLRRDQWRAGTAGVAGSSTGVATVALSKKVAAATLSKIASKKSFQAVGTMVGKALAKKGGGALAAAGIASAICSPAGPVAIICVGIAGLKTWLIVDKVALEIDEAFSRDNFKEDILSAIHEQKDELISAINNRQEIIITNLANEAQRRLDAIFIPVRDGL
ncbi:MAG: hypothetical protein K0A93_12710 [Desulfuromonadaceae bacterium]|nr:hypothetical protein [Desulfuromonadaceae bacterium]